MNTDECIYRSIVAMAAAFAIVGFIWVAGYYCQASQESQEIHQEMMEMLKNDKR